MKIFYNKNFPFYGRTKPKSGAEPLYHSLVTSLYMYIYIPESNGYIVDTCLRIIPTQPCNIA